MSADLLTAVLARPAHLPVMPDFQAGHDRLDTLPDPVTLDLTSPEEDVMNLLPNIGPEAYLDADGGLRPGAPRLAGHQIIKNLEKAFGDESEVTSLVVAGYRLILSAGLSWGDAPTDACQAIWDAQALPDEVLLAMGFTPKFDQPMSRRVFAPGPVTDSDVVDAIALGLGTQSGWNGAADLEWVAETIAKVRRHPGGTDHPEKYLAAYRDTFDFDPTEDDFLTQFVDEEAGD